MNKWKKVAVVPVVIGSGLNAYGVIRGFGEEGIRSISISDSKKVFIRSSKYLERHIALADINSDEQAFIEGLIGLGKEIAPRRGMFFPTHDEQVLAIAKYAERLKPYFEIPFSDYETCCSILDKSQFSKICKKIGVPTVKEQLVHSVEEAKACLDELRFPLIVKANSWNIEMVKKIGNKNSVCAGLEEYITFVERYYSESPQKELLVQEYIKDSDRLMPNVNTFTDREGTMQCVFVSVKPRQYPPQSGTSIATNAEDPENPQYQGIVESAKKILKAYSFYGLAGIEFKYDAEESCYKIIEMNPRSEFPNYLQTLVGQNMAYQLWRYHQGMEVTIPTYPKVKHAQCVVPFNDWFYTCKLNRINAKTYAMTRRERKKTLLLPRTLYGLTAKDIRPYLYFYLVSAIKGSVSYYRIRHNVPAVESTKEYIKRKYLGKRPKKK